MHDKRYIQMLLCIIFRSCIRYFLFQPLPLNGSNFFFFVLEISYHLIALSRSFIHRKVQCVYLSISSEISRYKDGSNSATKPIRHLVNPTLFIRLMSMKYEPEQQTYRITCVQRRHESVCAQSGQSLRCPHEGALDTWLLTECPADGQVDLSLRFAYFQFCRFCYVPAHIIAYGISLKFLIRQFWSDITILNSNWNEPPHDKTNKVASAPNEDSDQPGHPPSLIRVFAVRMKKHCGLSYLLSALQRLWSAWAADAQADLSLRWAHKPFCFFVVRRLKCVWCLSNIVMSGLLLPGGLCLVSARPQPAEYTIGIWLERANQMTVNDWFPAHSFFPVYTGTQLLMTIIDARSIANAYYYGVSYARPGLLQMRRSTFRALER